MSQKYAVVQGAICECQFGDFPDKLKILSHQKYYANDAEGSEKLIATSMELGGSTFEKNTFGQCKLQPTGSSFKPCQIVVTQWDGFYENVELSNGGKTLLEDSKAICPIAGSPCISILHHGQSMEVSASSTDNTNPDTHNQMNPLTDVNALGNQSSNVKEIIVS
ncbi:DUF4280 domain-containing protein [Aquimarina hainanensis]|uniref:DUF4280 domain-containing protein n=1 Tax=Aquimarina hainanensis TaxID=1578017 RepID=A0ABW5N7Z5_9FLAO|nr:DUF4280 domain-containing protein [Aquimarina sp. TRL1]QKX05025.1 DUF4280 domain-containing protein [Aquimarina sp. TRL1]